MNAFPLLDAEAADSLALARLDDDGAPAAAVFVASPGSPGTARHPYRRGGSGAPVSTGQEPST